ncbi:MAG TPA: ABC transporter ATP-binding protein [Nitrososphaerales archaeon]|nr:ABC transporter ATP-binding protein [Nitrososphaerales archaeon]
MPLLNVVNLVSGYQKLAIIQGISIKVEQGEIIAVIGPNGSGKSTLVKSIFGLTSIFEGSVEFSGRKISGSKPEDIARMGLGYVPQVSNVFPELTVKENLLLGAIATGDKSERLSRLDSVVKMFQILKEREKQRAGTLSGGERQMLAIGRALMAKPMMLLLDEPTAALAPIIADQVLNKLREIHESGVTLLLVEQNARKALGLASRGVVLTQGKKVFDGTPAQIENEEQIIRMYLGTAGSGEKGPAGNGP